MSQYGTHEFHCRTVSCFFWSLSLAGALTLQTSAQSTDVLTWHNDNSRTGQALNEQILTPTNVNTNHFGKTWFLNADGQVYAQPLYAAGVDIGNFGLRNVVYIETENDSVYAYDADSTNLFWKVTMLGSNEVPSDDHGCSQITPQIGITATPVIDRQLGPNGTIFIAAMSKTTNNQYIQRLHALDMSTGEDRIPPVIVTAKYPGLGEESDGTNDIFNPAQYKERAGLLLLNGVVYTAWASHCDFAPYTGWIMGYDEQTLVQTNVINIEPNGDESSIWMAGAGLAADTNGNLYFLVANGTFDTNLTAGGFPNKGDYGNAFVKVSTAGGKLAVADYFDEYNNVSESGQDQDLGSGGAILLPPMTDAQGNVRQLAAGAGKDANIYIVDCTNMGKFNPTNNNVYQEVTNGLQAGLWGAPAYYNGCLFYGPQNNALAAYRFKKGVLTTSTSHSSASFTYPGTTPSVSANGTSNGIVWATQITSPAVLYAYDPSNLTVSYYNSSQAGSRDALPSAGVKFATPTIASARVYVETANGVGVYGLLDTSTLTPLQIWRNTYFHNPSDVGAGANGASPEGDNVPDLIKYALGLNPLVAATESQLPQGAIQPDNGTNYLTLTINRSAEPTDVTYTVQVANDLVSGWSSGPPYTVTLTNTSSLLVVRDNVPVPAETARYIRLVVSNP
jgi:hypothetical protein